MRGGRLVMLGRKSLPAMDKVDTILGKDSEFKGTLHSDGVLRVDGKFEGEIHHRGDLVIGDTAVVVANLKARHVTVAGEVRGNIHAEGRLELATTARVYGDISMGNLVVADGAIFHGKSEMREDGKGTSKVQPKAGVA